MAFKYPTPEQVKAINPEILRQDAIDRAVQLAADEEANRLGDEIRAAMGQMGPPWRFRGERWLGLEKDYVKHTARLEAMKRHEKELKRAGYCARFELSDAHGCYLLTVTFSKK